MTPSMKKVLLQLRDIALLFAVGFGMAYFFNTRSYLIVGLFSSFMWVFLWKGNEFISHNVWTRKSWLSAPVISFVVGLVATIIYSGGVVFLLIRVFEWLFDIRFGDISDIIYSSVTVSIIITFFMNGRAFLFKWRQAIRDAESLKRETLSAQYESLKNQVNPHFLFNSLNTLTNLVYVDQDKAARFIKQLSEVYRYTLETKNKEVISLEEELRFLNSYVYLQQIRCGEKLKIDLQLDGFKSGVAPMAIQMLVENAIKHNAMSDKLPLRILVRAEDDYLVVENNIQPKSVIESDNNGIGLDNIRKRYSFLTDKPMFVENDGKIFRVKLPATPLPV